MKCTTIRGISVSFSGEDVLRSIGMSPEHHFAEVFCRLVKESEKIADPRGFYLECPVEQHTEHGVKLRGISFYSSALSAAIGDNEVVYPYLVTCGQELADYAAGLTDMAELFAIDAIMEFYRKLVERDLWGSICHQLPENTAVDHANVGELPNWEIREQKKIFDLFGEEADRLGVTLNDAYMMNPLKSLSGIAYGTAGAPAECAGCNAKNCALRNAPFDKKVYLKTFYRA